MVSFFVQDACQQVEVKDWPKRSSIQFLFEVSMLNSRVMIAIVVIFGNGCHPKWLQYEDQFKLSGIQFLLKIAILFIFGKI